MKATVSWQDNMTFIGTANSGFPIKMDADVSVGGNDAGARPMELLALGLAGCTAMDVLAILKKKRQQITYFEVRMDAPRSKEHPMVFTSASLTYVVTGNKVSEEAVLRSIELAATKYCPAQFMFARVFPIALHYEIYEDEEGERGKRLIVQGMWQNLLP